MHKTIALRKFRPAILVSNFNKLEAKWFRMTLLGPHFSPFGCFRPIRVFNRIHKIRSHPAHFRHRNVLGLTKHARFAGKAHVQRLGVYVFTKLQILLETHPMCPPVIPWTPHFFALLQWPDSFLPIVSGFNGSSLYDATTWKTN